MTSFKSRDIAVRYARLTCPTMRRSLITATLQEQSEASSAEIATVSRVKSTISPDELNGSIRPRGGSNSFSLIGRNIRRIRRALCTLLTRLLKTNASVQTNSHESGGRGLNLTLKCSWCGTLIPAPMIPPKIKCPCCGAEYSKTKKD